MISTLTGAHLKPQIQNSLLNIKVIKFQALSLLLMIVILH